jgi:hypothetical protein
MRQPAFTGFWLAANRRAAEALGHRPPPLAIARRPRSTQWLTTLGLTADAASLGSRRQNSPRFLTTSTARVARQRRLTHH